jgi:hypothetical protein
MNNSTNLELINLIITFKLPFKIAPTRAHYKRDPSNFICRPKAYAEWHLFKVSAMFEESLFIFIYMILTDLNKNLVTVFLVNA